MDIISQLLNPAVLALMIPIISVGGTFFYLIRRQELRAKIKANLGTEEKKLIKQILQNNQDLNERLSNLESIVTSFDKDLLALKENNETNTQKVKNISQGLKPE